jgi:hypothetical protein
VMMESEIVMVNLLVDLSDYGPTFLVTARCGPARRVVWEGGGRNPFLSLLGVNTHITRFLEDLAIIQRLDISGVQV